MKGGIDDMKGRQSDCSVGTIRRTAYPFHWEEMMAREENRSAVSEEIWKLAIRQDESGNLDEDRFLIGGGCTRLAIHPRRKEQAVRSAQPVREAVSSPSRNVTCIR